MINVRIYRNNEKQAIGFTVKNHGESLVCAAVSMLVINTVNSITSLTSLSESDFRCDYNEGGGFITFFLNETTERDYGAGLLLDAMVLGLESVTEQHPKEVELKECI